MSFIVDGMQADVHWISEKHKNGKITKEQGIIYVPVYQQKLGQATADSYAGKLPGKVYEARYNGSDKSNWENDAIAQDIFVFDKKLGPNFAYDDEIRKLINKLHRKGEIKFRANVNKQQDENSNNEKLIGYNRKRDFKHLLRIIKQSLGIENYYDTKAPIVWRWGQEPAIKKIVAALRKHKLALFAGYTSFGKTKIGVEVATQICQGGGLVLVTTPITDTKLGFKENIENYHFGNNRAIETVYLDSKEFVKHSPKSLRKEADNGKLIFIVLTVQDLRYDDHTADKDSKVIKLRNKYDALKGLVDLWIRDERHTQYNGPITSERLEGMTAEYELDLTATPYNVIDQYKAKQVITRTLLWGLRNQQNTKLPTIRIDAINTPFGKISDRIKNLFELEEGFDGRKLFLRKAGKFILANELLTLADRFYGMTIDKDKNQLSISNDTELSDVSKRCGMWVLPDGQSGDGANNYVPALANLLNSVNSGTYYVDSYSIERECPKDKSINDYINELLNKHARVIILTCGKFLTGTDITPLGHIVLFDKINNIMLFEQVMGRMIRQYPGKDEVKLYTLAPGMETKLALARLARANTELNQGMTEYDFLSCVPLTEYGSAGATKITPKDILSGMADWSQTRLRERLPQVSLINMLTGIDTTLWDKVSLSEYKGNAPSNEFSDDNGAKVKIKKTKEEEKQEKKNEKDSRTKAQRIAEAIQVVVQESTDVAYVHKCYDFRKLFKNSALTIRFPKGECQAVLDTAMQVNAIADMLDNYYAERKFIYDQKGYEEVRTIVFNNTTRRVQIGMVVTPQNMVSEALDSWSI